VDQHGRVKAYLPSCQLRRSCAPGQPFEVDVRYSKRAPEAPRSPRRAASSRGWSGRASGWLGLAGRSSAGAQAVQQGQPARRVPFSAGCRDPAWSCRGPCSRPAPPHLDLAPALAGRCELTRFRDVRHAARPSTTRPHLVAALAPRWVRPPRRERPSVRPSTSPPPWTAHPAAAEMSGDGFNRCPWRPAQVRYWFNMGTGGFARSRWRAASTPFTPWPLAT
jgi:hypothetical protein